MRRSKVVRILVAAAVGAVLVAIIVACQPKPIGAGTKIPITEKSYFVVPQGWSCARPQFGDDRRYDFFIQRDKVALGRGELAFRGAASGPGFSALKKAAERKGVRTAEKRSGLKLGRATLTFTGFCYLLDPYEDNIYHRTVTPPWAYLAYAETTCDGMWIAVGACYDIPADVVARGATTVPPNVVASYEADFVKTLGASLHFE